MIKELKFTDAYIAKMNAKAIRNALASDIFYSYELGVKLRRRLHWLARAGYRMRHSPVRYLQFMARWECKFEVCHAQWKNHPNVWELFTIVSQHVYGDTIEECLDKAIRSERDRKNFLRHDKNEIIN